MKGSSSFLMSTMSTKVILMVGTRSQRRQSGPRMTASDTRLEMKWAKNIAMERRLARSVTTRKWRLGAEEKVSMLEKVRSTLNSAVKRSIGFTTGFHNHGEGPY